MTDSTKLPTARVEARPTRSRAWILPVLAFLAALWLGWDAWRRRGPAIEILAAEGHGIQAGDALRYRGITVGVVEAVELGEELQGVTLAVRLHPEAGDLARAGSRFWIVRPHLSLEGIEGLETVVGARYLQVLPGPRGASRRSQFVALPDPPVTGPEELGGLEIVLEAPSRSGLAPGAPLSYRGIQVGTVLSVALANDSRTVEVRAVVRRAYAELVREDTRFWESGGLSVSLGWTGGFRVELDTLRTLVVGGLSMATPTRPGRRVRTGHRFTLSDEPDETWFDWRPALAIGNELLPPDAVLPEPVRVRLVYENSGFLGREHEVDGWALLVEGGLLGPTELLVPPDTARSEGATLEFFGRQVPVGGAPSWNDGHLARRPLSLPERKPWPRERRRALAEPEDCLLVTDDPAGAIALAAARMSLDGETWSLDRALSFQDSWHGAPVLARSDGKLVGVLLVEGGEGRIAPVPGR